MKTTPETAKEALLSVREVLGGLDDWSFDAIHTACFDLIAKMQVKNGWLLWPLRVALSGMQFTPGGGTCQGTFAVNFQSGSAPRRRQKRILPGEELHKSAAVSHLFYTAAPFVNAYFDFFANSGL